MRLVAVAALASVLGGACGGSGGNESAATSTTSATVTTAAPTATTAPRLPPAAEDAAAAKRVLLRTADLPGYKQSPSSQVSPYATVYSRCTGNPLMPGGTSARSAGQGPFVNDETATVRSVQTTAVSSFAVFADTESDARRAIADVSRPDVAPCVGRSLLADATSLTSQSGAATQTSAALPVLKVGDDAAGLRTTVPVWSRTTSTSPW